MHGVLLAGFGRFTDGFLVRKKEKKKGVDEIFCWCLERVAGGGEKRRKEGGTGHGVFRQGGGEWDRGLVERNGGAGYHLTTLLLYSGM